MDKYNQNETVLAQALAEMEQANKELIKENKALKENLKSFSEKLATLSQNMVTWENHQQVVKDCMEKIQSKANELAELNLKYDSLVKERRYWAPNNGQGISFDGSSSNATYGFGLSMPCLP